jgi:hypothetical protein
MNIPRGKYIAKNADPDKHEAEHFFICETCGGWIDCHDLGSVFDHQGLYNLPPEDRKHQSQSDALVPVHTRAVHLFGGSGFNSQR